MYRVVILRRAQTEGDAIVAWLHERSPLGAARWMDAYESIYPVLTSRPESCGVAPESAVCDYEIRQILFKTSQGNKYRALFTIVESEVRILHVRGPGQPPIEPEPLADE